ncbi:hypothetical protein AACH06_03995 [Ideonella sp. DXS29W]|uniref:Uncharacterized protein n=1 Tax=Ideonella lacteola TaxID=2984193 RepID=A0ABU9BMW2_9BURK
MSTTANRSDPDLMCAVGLAWGLVSSHRAEDAATLMRACEMLWPEAEETRAMSAVCASLNGAPAEDSPEVQALPSRWSSLVQMVRARCRLWLAQ